MIEQQQAGGGGADRNPGGSWRQQLARKLLDAFMPIETGRDLRNNYIWNDNAITEDCIICLEPLMDEDLCRLTYCFHPIHQVCLDQWLKSNSNCPYCRQHLDLRFLVTQNQEFTDQKKDRQLQKLNRELAQLPIYRDIKSEYQSLIDQMQTKLSELHRSSEIPFHIVQECLNDKPALHDSDLFDSVLRGHLNSNLNSQDPAPPHVFESPELLSHLGEGRLDAIASIPSEYQSFTMQNDFQANLLEISKNQQYDSPIVMNRIQDISSIKQSKNQSINQTIQTPSPTDFISRQQHIVEKPLHHPPVIQINHHTNHKEQKPNLQSPKPQPYEQSKTTLHKNQSSKQLEKKEISPPKVYLEPPQLSSIQNVKRRKKQSNQLPMAVMQTPPLNETLDQIQMEATRQPELQQTQSLATFTRSKSSRKKKEMTQSSSQQALIPERRKTKKRESQETNTPITPPLNPRISPPHFEQDYEVLTDSKMIPMPRYVSFKGTDPQSPAFPAEKVVEEQAHPNISTRVSNTGMFKIKSVFKSTKKKPR